MQMKPASANSFATSPARRIFSFRSSGEKVKSEQRPRRRLSPSSTQTCLPCSNNARSSRPASVDLPEPLKPVNHTTAPLCPFRAARSAAVTVRPSRSCLDITMTCSLSLSPRLVPVNIDKMETQERFAATNGQFPAQLQAAADLLEAIVNDRGLLAQVPAADRERLLQAAGQVSRPDAPARRRLLNAKRRQRKAERVEHDENLLAQTGIRALRTQPVFTTPNIYPPAASEEIELNGDSELREVVDPQNCYICKHEYSVLHPFYDQLCTPCADLNFRKRTELADLSGRVALLSGGRVKIGYQAGIKLLRAGAQLIVTTRFPRNAAARYASEPDFNNWGHRLEIFGLDLRHTPSVEAFCRHLLKTRKRLDFIINNACQTERRPPDFYQHMMADENGPLQSLPAQAGRLLGTYEGLRGYHLLPAGELPLAGDPASDLADLRHSAQLSQVPLLPDELAAQHDLFPEGRLDQDLQQVDLRER